MIKNQPHHENKKMQKHLLKKASHLQHDLRHLASAFDRYHPHCDDKYLHHNHDMIKIKM